MIVLYSGLPGGGKTTDVARLIYRWLHVYKRPVIANFKFNAKACNPKGRGDFLYMDNKDITQDFLIDFSEQYLKYWGLKKVVEEEILLVLDESQLLFNSRAWHNQDRMGWVSFFSQHRKLGYRVILIAQDAIMLDKQIRVMIEIEKKHAKAKNMGLTGLIISLPFRGNLFMVRDIYFPSQDKLGISFFAGNNFYYKLFDSYTRFSA